MSKFAYTVRVISRLLDGVVKKVRSVLLLGDVDVDVGSRIQDSGTGLMLKCWNVESDLPLLGGALVRCANCEARCPEEASIH